MKTRILVTGGAGFIGSHLVETLVQQGLKVAVVDDLSGGYRANVNPKATFFRCDIRQYAQVERVFATFKPHVVYHLAANAAESKAQFSPMDITTRNYEGSVKVLTAAINTKVKRFIFTSSIAVYGHQQTPFLETTQPQPEDIYGITKYAFEESLKILSDVHGYEYVIVRPHNVYGPRQNMRDPYRNVVTIFMNSLLRKQPLYIYGDGEQQRSFSYVDDVVDALYQCLVRDVAGMVLNVGSSKHHSVLQLARKIIAISGVRVPLEFLPLRPREVVMAISDHKLSKRYLDSQERTSLDEGLLATWKWVEAQGYQKPKYSSMEIESPLVPKNWQ